VRVAVADAVDDADSVGVRLEVAVREDVRALVEDAARVRERWKQRPNPTHNRPS
jgi:hypothetical protein